MVRVDDLKKDTLNWVMKKECVITFCIFAFEKSSKFQRCMTKEYAIDGKIYIKNFLEINQISSLSVYL